MTDHRELSAEALDRLYDVTVGVPDVDGLQAGYRAASDAVVAEGAGRLDIAYGGDSLQRLDIFVPTRARRAPIMVYIHGGYWKGGGKAGRRFPAPLYNGAGIVWVPIDYRLAPAVSLDEIVADARAAIGWIHANAAGFGGDPERIVVSGNSAGGHLVGMLLAPGWQDAHGLPADVLKGACAMSGIFDLAPLRRIATGAHLALDDESAARNSPIRRIPEACCPVVVAWGARESSEFRRQSEDYARALVRAGHEVRTIAAEGHDHFSLMGEMARRESEIGRAMLALALSDPAGDGR